MSDQNHDTDWRQQRRENRWARREARLQRLGSRRVGWVLGAILILAGLALLLESLGLPFLQNWWALFILIPAFGAFAGALEIYRHNGRLTRGVAASMAWGLVLTVVAALLLANVYSGFIWGALLILGGLALLATVLARG